MARNKRYERIETLIKTTYTTGTQNQDEPRLKTSVNHTRSGLRRECLQMGQDTKFRESREAASTVHHQEHFGRG
jgi:hypothetical protein